MMEGLKGWLLSVLTVSLICALAEAMTKPGPTGRVVRLICGMALLCGVLLPLTGGPEGGEAALRPSWEDWTAGDRDALQEQLNREMKALIEARCEAYIQDKGREMNAEVRLRIRCTETENGVFVPAEAEILSPLPGPVRAEVKRLLEQELGVPAERQNWHTEEASP